MTLQKLDFRLNLAGQRAPAGHELPPLHNVTWSVITWPSLKRSTHRRCEERHVPIARLAPTTVPDRNDSHGDRLREESHAAIRGALGRQAFLDPVVHELRQHPLQDRLPESGGGHGSVGTRVETGSHDRRVAHATGEHEGGPSRGGARGETAPAVAGHRAHGTSELNGLPLARIPGHPALANLGQAFLQTTTGFRRCRIIPNVSHLPREGGGAGPHQQDMGCAEHIPGNANRIFHLFDGRDPARFEVRVHQGSVHLDAPIDPHARPGPGVEPRVVLEDHNRLDDSVERPPPATKDGDSDHAGRRGRIPDRCVRAGTAVREENWMHATPWTDYPSFKLCEVAASPAPRKTEGGPADPRSDVEARRESHAVRPSTFRSHRGSANPLPCPSRRPDIDRGIRT